MGVGAFLLGTALSQRGTETTVQDTTGERIEPDEMEMMIGKSNTQFTRRHPDTKFKFTNQITNKPIQVVYTSGEFFVSGSTATSITTRKGILDF